MNTPSLDDVEQEMGERSRNTKADIKPRIENCDEMMLFLRPNLVVVVIQSFLTFYLEY